jgi:hypothetical protein
MHAMIPARIDEMETPRAWLDSARGRQFVELEHGQISETLPRLIGHRLVQLGRWGLDDALYRASPMLQHWVVGMGQDTGVHLRCDGRSLPIASRSVDAILMPHSLEQAPSPHRLLREVDRVLCAHGQVIVTGFSPWGLWAAGRRLPWGKPHYPASSRFYSLNRVRDWLELLDFEVVEVHRFGLYFPHLQNPGGPEAVRHLLGPLCQAYQVLARKRVVPLTLVRPRWPRPAVVPPAVLPEARVHRVR